MLELPFSIITRRGTCSWLSTNKKIFSAMDNNHIESPLYWIWGLKKDDKVWIAIEESITQSKSFVIDFMKKTGPSEYTEIKKVFEPYEVKVVNKWEMNNGVDKGFIIEFDRRGRFLENIVLISPNIASGNNVKSNISPWHIFKKESLCKQYCIGRNRERFSTFECDAIQQSLAKMQERILALKKSIDLE